jgi:hypothetical protein
MPHGERQQKDCPATARTLRAAKANRDTVSIHDLLSKPKPAARSATLLLQRVETGFSARMVGIPWPLSATAMWTRFPTIPPREQRSQARRCDHLKALRKIFLARDKRDLVAATEMPVSSATSCTDLLLE